MSGDGIKIVKLGDTGTPLTTIAPAAAPTHAAGKSRKVRREKKPKFGILKGGKTARTKPRFEGVRDPTSSPPLKKSMKLRILTEKGAKTRRQEIVESARKMPITKIRQTLRKNGLPVKDSAPEKLTRKIYEDAQEAGMISSD